MAAISANWITKCEKACRGGNGRPGTNGTKRAAQFTMTQDHLAIKLVDREGGGDFWSPNLFPLKDRGSLPAHVAGTCTVWVPNWSSKAVTGGIARQWPSSMIICHVPATAISALRQLVTWLGVLAHSSRSKNAEILGHCCINAKILLATPRSVNERPFGTLETWQADNEGSCWARLGQQLDQLQRTDRHRHPYPHQWSNAPRHPAQLAGRPERAQLSGSADGWWP